LRLAQVAASTEPHAAAVLGALGGTPVVRDLRVVLPYASLRRAQDILASVAPRSNYCAILIDARPAVAAAVCDISVTTHRACRFPTRFCHTKLSPEEISLSRITQPEDMRGFMKPRSDDELCHNMDRWQRELKR
jgi:hypothetical protein